MTIKTERLKFETKGAGDFLNLTDRLAAALKKSGLEEGSMTVFAVGSTIGIATFEFEPGLIR